MTNEELQIRKDRMRFTKNTLSSNLAILAIIFDVLYFVSIYQSDVGSWYYQILIGASILYNLVFLLAAFLSSEGIKNYDVNYAYLLIALGVGQIVRIFILPAKAHAAVVTLQGAETAVMTNGQYTYVVGCLIASAVCCLVAAAVGMQKTKTLNDYLASMKKTA